MSDSAIFDICFKYFAVVVADYLFFKGKFSEKHLRL